MVTTQLDVEHLFTLTAEVPGNPNAQIRGGPSGTRVIANVTGGTFEGERLRGTIIGPGGDWVSVRDNGTIHLDVRLLLVTDDGESILMTYNGIGTRGEDGELSIRTAPTFQVGADAYRWLNDVQAVAIGSSADGVVSYEVYALA